VKWLIGCSGFHYKHWKGVYYPEDLPQTKWFKYYCQHFNTLELNNTFYSFPKLSSLQKWYADSPPSFVFTVKAYRGITHYNKFNNTQERVNELYQVLTNGLQEKLGPVLFQMPPNFLYSEERLQKIIENLNPAFTNVVEFRHGSWWQPTVYHQLAQHNISFCGMSHPTLPATIVQNAPDLYYRMHGNQQLYASAYSTAELQDFAQKIEETKAKQAFVYFNNDIGASAIANAKELIELVIAR
jgi:uncharacterized protein YecE (DUF72 family)